MSKQIVTKQGDKRDIPDLFAYNGGIWFFSFVGDETYTDPADSSVWTWGGVTNDVDEVLAVVYEGVFLVQTYSLSDCRAQDGSFYWDDTNGILYVHWFDFSDDYYFSRDLGVLSTIIAGFANGWSKVSHNVYDSVFYDPTITDISGLSKKADLTKLGLVTFDDSSFSLTDRTNQLYDQSGVDSVGIPLRVYLIDKDATTLEEKDRVFTAVYNGYKHSRAEMQYQIVESRFFQNLPVCPNVISETAFPNAGDNIGEIIPTAWGEIRRGRMLLTNEDNLDSSTSGTAVFIVADPTLYAVRAISTIYDEAGDTQTIVTTNLTACTVDVTKPAGVSVGDLKNWTWGGQGYDIAGTYNNGLDIIKAAYLTLANISFTVSTYDVNTWNVETAANTAAIGISVLSEKGFVEEIIEPITTSLQGIVEILGDGRISWASRDTSSIPIVDIPIIKAYDQINLPEIIVDPKETVSELQVTYSPNFKSKEPLSYIYTDDRNEVIKNYTINRRDPISPLKTVLVNESDARAVAIEIMETSASPVRIVSVQSLELLINARFFGIVGIDTGTFGNENIEYGELLIIDPDYNSFIQNIQIRVIPDYKPKVYVQGDGFSSYEINNVTSGCSDKEINDVNTGYAYTRYV